MTARVTPMPGGKVGVRATLVDWHAAGYFRDFTGAGSEVDRHCLNHREASRLAEYVNGQVEAKARLAALKQTEVEHA
jgi:hypothetical protein